MGVPRTFGSDCRYKAYCSKLLDIRSPGVMIDFEIIDKIDNTFDPLFIKAVLLQRMDLTITTSSHPFLSSSFLVADLSSQLFPQFFSIYLRYITHNLLAFQLF